MHVNIQRSGLTPNFLNEIQETVGGSVTCPIVRYNIYSQEFGSSIVHKTIDGISRAQNLYLIVTISAPPFIDSCVVFCASNDLLCAWLAKIEAFRIFIMHYL